MSFEIRDYKQGNTLGVSFGRTRRSVWINFRMFFHSLRLELVYAYR